MNGRLPWIWGLTLVLLPVWGTAWAQTATPVPPWAATANADGYLLAAGDAAGWMPGSKGADAVSEYAFGDQDAGAQTTFALARSQSLSAGPKAIGLEVLVFESAGPATAYCAGVEVWALDQAGNPAPNPTWHSAQNDVGSPLLAGNGGAAFSDPGTLVIHYGRAFARIADSGQQAAGQEALKAVGLAWLDKASKLSQGGAPTVATGPAPTAVTGPAPTVATGPAVPAATPSGQDAIVVTQPAEGSTVGPNIEVVGKAAPNQLVVSYILAFRTDTGEQVRNVPGFRGRSKDTGDFAFRVATPRISFGDQKAQVRYELRLYIMRPDGGKGQETVVNLLGPTP